MLHVEPHAVHRQMRFAPEFGHAGTYMIAFYIRVTGNVNPSEEMRTITILPPASDIRWKRNILSPP
jgi:hypothetical protein